LWNKNERAIHPPKSTAYFVNNEPDSGQIEWLSDTFYQSTMRLKTDDGYFHSAIGFIEEKNIGQNNNRGRVNWWVSEETAQQ